jgi:regulator of protease activity HflC (stomatin/prohibitin superfamily)
MNQIALQTDWVFCAFAPLSWWQYFILILFTKLGMIKCHSLTLKRRIPMNLKVISIVVLLVALVFACGIVASCDKVEPGYAGIVVNNYGDQKGVDDFPVITGRVFYNPFTKDLYKFPTFQQNIVWTKDKNEGSRNDESITFNSIEGAVINADIAISYSLVSEMVPSLFVEFRKNIDHITDVYMRSQVRDTFSRHASRMKVVDVFGSKKQELQENVKLDLNKRLNEKGFNFDMVSIVGALRVDNRVAQSINAVIEATQKAIEAENKVRQSVAEADQLVARARGDSSAAVIRASGVQKANQLIRSSLTSQLIQFEAIKKWDGMMPKVTGETIPLIDVSKIGG